MTGPDTKKQCRGCGAPLTKENDSEAHVIPNALGGRLKPKGIICTACNTELDKIADNALVKAFGDWPPLLDIPRDRGSHPPKLIETRNGRRVRLEPNGSMTLADVKYDVQPTEDGHAVQIAVGNMKTFRQLLNRAKKEFPKLDVKAAEQHARVVGIEDGDELKMGLDFSPEAVFGGVVTAFWLYLIHTTGRAFMDWKRLLEVIANMKAHGGMFRYLVTGLPGLEGPEIPLGHKIVIRSIPSSGEMIAYIEILGLLKIGGLFAKAPPDSILVEHIYAYDVLGKADRSSEFSIKETAFEKQKWKEVGLGVSDAAALRSHLESELERTFVQRYRDRFTDPSQGSTNP